MKYLTLLSIFFLTILESTFLSFPFLFVGLLLSTLFIKTGAIFSFALVSGILLDLLAVRPLGATGLFFVVFLYLVQLYDRKYEITSVTFVGVASFLGCYFYFWVFGEHDILFRSVISALITSILFYVAKKKYGISFKNESRKNERFKRV
jgi:cell shape-determining protein MreD